MKQTLCPHKCQDTNCLKSGFNVLKAYHTDWANEGYINFFMSRCQFRIISGQCDFLRNCIEINTFQVTKGRSKITHISLSMIKCCNIRFSVPILFWYDFSGGSSLRFSYPESNYTIPLAESHTSIQAAL